MSPADYHRFHSPSIHTADYRRHIVGYLSPVKPSYVNSHKDVFKQNERVNIFGRWEQGFYFESAVGATNVGSIKLDFDEDVVTNQTFCEHPYYYDKNYITNVAAEKATPVGQYLKADSFEKEKDIVGDSTALTFEKGELTGRFEMGSTIVLVFECDQKTSFNIHPGKKLWLGEQIVSRKSD